MIKANEGRRRSKSVWSPSGTKRLCTRMCTGGTSESTCWKSQCGTNRKFRMRKAVSWERQVKHMYSYPLSYCDFPYQFPFFPTLLQILIELETALLDDKPHWYKLQTHDVSSIPLPHPSPYLPRRHTHSDTPSKKLQREWRARSQTLYY